MKSNSPENTSRFVHALSRSDQFLLVGNTYEELASHLNAPPKKDVTVLDPDSGNQLFENLKDPRFKTLVLCNTLSHAKAPEDFLQKVSTSLTKDQVVVLLEEDLFHYASLFDGDSELPKLSFSRIRKLISHNHLEIVDQVFLKDKASGQTKFPIFLEGIDSILDHSAPELNSNSAVLTLRKKTIHLPLREHPKHHHEVPSL